MDISNTEIIRALSQQGRGRITSVTIENFKGIGDAVTVPIRPITLLFGKNSSGKSTVLHALRYHYAICNNELRSTIEMSGGHDIDLGDFRSLVHRHELDRKIRIRITYAPNVIDKQNQIYLLWNEVVTGWKEDTHVESVLLGCVINGEEMCFIISGELPDDAVVGPNGRVLIPKKLDAHDQAAGVVSGVALGTVLGLPFGPLGAAVGAAIGKASSKWLRSLQESKKLDAIRHLGPFREVLRDDYKTHQTSDESRWEKGVGAWEALARDSVLFEKTNHYMQDVLKLRYSINQSKLDEQFHLHDEDNNIDIGLSDVGVGISQVIPVVVGALDDSQNLGIFAVEQPELHIHPALQVALGDVFIDGIKNSNRTLLIETHSEHLLLRIMRRMRETFEDRIEENRFPVTPDDIAVLFVEWHDSQTIIREMPVNERGDLVKAWPGGFFEEDIEEVFA